MIGTVVAGPVGLFAGAKIGAALGLGIGGTAGSLLLIFQSTFGQKLIFWFSGQKVIKNFNLKFIPYYLQRGITKLHIFAKRNNSIFIF